MWDRSIRGVSLGHLSGIGLNLVLVASVYWLLQRGTHRCI